MQTTNKTLLELKAWSLIALDYFARAPLGSPLERRKRATWDSLDRVRPPAKSVPVPELQTSEYSFAALRRLSEGFRRPVVVRGLFADAPALERWKTPEYMLERNRDEKYLVATCGRLELQLKLASELDPKDFARVFPLAELPLLEIIERIKQGEPLYINNLDTIFRRDPRLLADLAIPQIVTEWWEGSDVPLDPVMVQMFMGAGTEDPETTTGSGLHCARHANLFIQVVGEKHWTLIDPRHTLFVHPTLRYEQPACAATPPLDLEQLPRLVVTLRPGDALYNPPFMWHQVRNAPGWNIGCATRELRFWATLRNSPMLTVLQEFSPMNRHFARRVTTKPVARFLRSLPFFVFSIALLQEALRGYVRPPMRAYADFDEHAPKGFGFLENLQERRTR
jgi:hypothetical protein